MPPVRKRLDFLGARHHPRIAMRSATNRRLRPPIPHNPSGRALQVPHQNGGNTRKAPFAQLGGGRHWDGGGALSFSPIPMAASSTPGTERWCCFSMIETRHIDIAVLDGGPMASQTTPLRFASTFLSHADPDKARAMAVAEALGRRGIVADRL